MFFIVFCLYVINICSANVINYDLLVGDLSFYNQTLVFALLENERNGTDMLQLIENLMAPWHNGNIFDEKHIVNECIVHSEIFINSVMIICKICWLMFYFTIVIVIMSFPFNIYQKIKSILNSKNKLNGAYDDI